MVASRRVRTITIPKPATVPPQAVTAPEWADAQASLDRVDPGAAAITATPNGGITHYRGGAPMVGRLPFIDAALEAGLLPHPTTDQSTAFNTLIDQVAAAGGGVIAIRGVYRANVVLKSGVVLSSMRQQYGYEGSVTAAVIKGVDDTNAFVIDTPVTSVSQAGIHGIDVVGPGSGTTGGGIRFQNAYWSSIKNVHTASHQDQGIIIVAGWANVIEDILAFNCLLNRTRSQVDGVVDVGGTDNFLHRIEATASLAAVTDANLRCAAIALRGANHFVSNCIGEISDQGWYVAAEFTRIENCRGDLNWGPDWNIPGPDNQLANVIAINGGRSAVNTYDAFTVSGVGNQLTNFKTHQTGVGSYRYSVTDTTNTSFVAHRTQYGLRTLGGYATAAWNVVNYLGSSPSPATTSIKPANSTASINVTEVGTVSFSEYGTATTVTAFTGGVNGQQLVLIGNPNVTIQNNGTINTTTGANVTLATNRAYRLVNYNGVWYQV